MAEAGDAGAVLFDIDGTLITTGGASDRAWRRAFLSCTESRSRSATTRARG